MNVDLYQMKPTMLFSLCAVCALMNSLHVWELTGSYQRYYLRRGKGAISPLKHLTLKCGNVDHGPEIDMGVLSAGYLRFNLNGILEGRQCVSLNYVY